MNIENYNDFAEYHFLSTCYGEGISDEKVYALFIVKVLSDYTPPINMTVST
jgi:hypothetical protein